MGLISSLKEFKACKVCLILNEDALGEDSSDFRKYLEKVVDVFLKFEPSATECVDIAFPGATGTLKVIAESCVALAISNIRLIKRIERSVRKVEPMLNGFDGQILRQAVQSLALLGWAVLYEPSRAPSLNYLLERGEPSIWAPTRINPFPQMRQHRNALLDAYGFLRMDDLIDACWMVFETVSSTVP